MAKETAHQLGTPLSSLMAWLELLKAQGVDESSIAEMNKDILRLETITDRFSKIGSENKGEPVNVDDLVRKSIDYLRKRISKKVDITINSANENLIVDLNPSLFEWVLENLTKNAVDAMEGKGAIVFNIEDKDNLVMIDVKDTGKGIPPGKLKTVFEPGFTTKKRGWGLGLSLAKRIVEEHHNGKIIVLNSVVDEGTTFRIILPKV